MPWSYRCCAHFAPCRSTSVACVSALIVAAEALPRLPSSTCRTRPVVALQKFAWAFLCLTPPTVTHDRQHMNQRQTCALLVQGPLMLLEHHDHDSRACGESVAAAGRTALEELDHCRGEGDKKPITTTGARAWRASHTPMKLTVHLLTLFVPHKRPYLHLHASERRCQRA